MDAAQLVSNAKGSSGLSVRALAAEAAIAGSTITRIESRRSDATTQNLGRIIEACGFRLTLSAARLGGPRRPRLGDLTDAWTWNGAVRPTWPRWRAWLDGIALHPEWTCDAIYPEPPPAGHPIVDAMLAAIAEKLADDVGLPRPAWTEAVGPLTQPFVPPARRRGAVAPQFAARLLMIDAASLYRDPSTVGV